MSIGKKKKDHLKEHAGVVLAAPVIMPKSDDPLRFWTNHFIDNTLVDLRPFAVGEFENPHPLGPTFGQWGGPFTGRPQLISELAPAIEARCALLRSASAASVIHTLRVWWRFFDSIESDSSPAGQHFGYVKSVADLSELHEAAAHRFGITGQNFRKFLAITNDARRLLVRTDANGTPLRLPPLLWTPPKEGHPVRSIIPEDQARELKTALKQDWERVRRTWALNDAIRVEAERRFAGMIPSGLSDEEERLLKNWQHFQRIQQVTGLLLPASEQILEGESRCSLNSRGLEILRMRAILFPTANDALVAFHLALMNSGWNPSTLGTVDAASPFLLVAHPKDDKQLVLSADGNAAATLQADKPRARGKTQFCTALKKHSSSPPMIVATYLKRTESLREILKRNYREACEELVRMENAGVERESINVHVKRVKKLWQGCRCVWLYLDRNGEINWLEAGDLPRFERKEMSKPLTYLGLVLERLNAKRVREGQAVIPPVNPSDFRDIYARWVYRQTGGNILAVMLALGHSTLSSTGRYLDNNIFSAESDEQARRFMGHLFSEFERGRLDLTILAQLVRHGPLTTEMEERLAEYRQLRRSRLGVGCADPLHPPAHVASGHVEGRLCGIQRCLTKCPHARFLPESLEGIAMRIEELLAMSDYLPRETWLRGGFQAELDEGESLLDVLYLPEAVAEARDKWREKIATGNHIVPGLAPIAPLEETA